MLDVLKRFFSKAATDISRDAYQQTEHDVRVATCALFLEMARIDEKFEIIETLWWIVYVDGKMDQYEHYLMNKLKNLLRLSYDQLIDAKLKVLHSS